MAEVLPPPMPATAQVGWCPHCGAVSTTMRFEEMPLAHCAPCNWTLWPDPKVVAVAMLFDTDGRILLLRRGIAPHRGAWALPGGFVGPREHPRLAATRECYEEIGCRVDLPHLVGVEMAPHEAPHGVVVVGYAGTVIAGVPQCTAEALEVAFVAPHQLPPIPFETHVSLVTTAVERRLGGAP